MNSEIISNVLQTLVKKYKLLQKTLVKTEDVTLIEYKIRPLKKVLQLVQNKSNLQDIQNIPGIGKGTIDRIKEIQKTGTLKELGEIDKEILYNKVVNKVALSLQQIIGIGPVNSLEFVKVHHVVSVREFIDKVNKGTIKVNDKIKLGIKYYGLLCTQIPRENIVKIKDHVIIPALKRVRVNCIPMAEICGSFRRKKSHSSDIDVLITCTENSILGMFISELVRIGFIVDGLTDTNVQTKYMGFCRYERKVYRIDIRFVKPESWATSLAYFTGSYQHNILMRGIAINKGLKLNEYGLFRSTGERIEVKSEKDLYRILEKPFVKPEYR